MGRRADEGADGGAEPPEAMGAEASEVGEVQGARPGRWSGNTGAITRETSQATTRVAGTQNVTRAGNRCCASACSPPVPRRA